MDMEQDHSDFVEPPAGSSLAKIAASGMTPAEYSRRHAPTVVPAVDMHDRLPVTITPFAIQKAIDKLNRSEAPSKYLTYCSCGVDNFIDRRECRSCRAPLVQGATASDHAALPHERIEAAERDHLAKMDAKVGEAVQKILPDHRWSMEKDSMAGQAIHGPNGTYVPIRSPLIAAVLEAALKGDLIRLQQARQDLIEFMSVHKAP